MSKSLLYSNIETDLLEASVRFQAMDRNIENNDLKPGSPLLGFAHIKVANGLTISTCLHCLRSIGSPTPASLRMAEENHRCEVAPRNRKLKT